MNIIDMLNINETLKEHGPSVEIPLGNGLTQVVALQDLNSVAQGRCAITDLDGYEEIVPILIRVYLEAMRHHGVI